MNHRRTPWIAASLALCLLGGAAGQAAAYNSLANNWNSQYPDVCPDLTAAASDCSLCHGGGFSLNPYGQDLANANRDFQAIQGVDSDGDGRTNSEEILLDCTLPGDSVSVPAFAASWGTIKALFR